MKQVGYLLSEELRSNVRRNVDIDGNKYKPVREKVSAYVRGGNIVKSHTRYRKRLVRTGKFNQKAVLYEAGPTNVRIYANPESYDSRVTYEDIIRYNDKNSPDLHGAHGTAIRRDGPKLFPGIAGNKEEEIKLLKRWPTAVNLIHDDVMDQIKVEARKHIKIVLKIA